jgi:8-oxo-dGTP diphosphatase
VAYTSDFPPFYVTVDIVLLTIRGDQVRALAVRRGNQPFRGRWALPGGFVDIEEDLADAAARELREETAVTAREVGLEQLATYGAPDRDPRHRTVSVAWLAVLPHGPEPTAGDDASHAEWRPVAELLTPGCLAFDHARILADGLERARAKLEYSGLATKFLEDEFTVAELRRVYEVMWGYPLDPGNFHRKVTRAEGFVERTGRSVAHGPGRPAELYRFAGAEVLYPPLTRRSLG